MRTLAVMAVLLLAAASAADDLVEDDPAEVFSSDAAAGRLRDIDDEIQREAVDPEEEPGDVPEGLPGIDDPYADEPDPELLPEDRSDDRPDLAPDDAEDADAPALEPAELDPDLLPATKKTPSAIPQNVLESPLKQSPLHTDGQ